MTTDNNEPITTETRPDPREEARRLASEFIRDSLKTYTEKADTSPEEKAEAMQSAALHHLEKMFSAPTEFFAVFEQITQKLISLHGTREEAEHRFAVEHAGLTSGMRYAEENGDDAEACRLLARRDCLGIMRLVNPSISISPDPKNSCPDTNTVTLTFTLTDTQPITTEEKWIRIDTEENKP